MSNQRGERRIAARFHERVWREAIRGFSGRAVEIAMGGDEAEPATIGERGVPAPERDPDAAFSRFENSVRSHYHG